MSVNEPEKLKLELVDLILKHVVIINESPDKDAINVFIRFNETNMITLERKTFTRLSPIQPMFGPPTNFITELTEATIDLNRITNIIKELKNE